jgi:hypothetical protein
MEHITFAKNGQWTLHKHLLEPKGVEGSATDKPYKTYASSNREGNLPKDFGQKGTLHNFNQGNTPKPEGRMNPRKVGKDHHKMNSVFEARNPGTGTG